MQGRKVVLCVTGGIAAYKAVEIARALSLLAADVRVVMTASAQLFVGAQTFAGITGNPVVTEMFDRSVDAPHVELARGADIVVVAPATANALAKMALGLADDVFSATMLMARCPVLVAPAMHTEMWEHPATQEHVRSLRDRGVVVVGPAEGQLMSGDVGPGRMSEPDDIVEAVLDQLGRAQELVGATVIVTAGGTQEPIDPVRFIGNRSSGLMGYTIAAEAARRGAKVILVSGPTQLDPPPGVELVPVKTADEMRTAVIEKAPAADAVVKAAAVADFRPETAAVAKLKKAEGPPRFRLVPTADILAELGASPELRKPGGVLVGFAAETETDPERLARIADEKRLSKGADFIVANDVSSPDSGFSVPTNRAVIAGSEGTRDLGLVTKEALARAVLDEIGRALGVASAS
jgi:phosphopantothenoylcysteine decarboxylase/phosphopantothenate--cysteine ligase